MIAPDFKGRLEEYTKWRSNLIQAMEMYKEWRVRYDMNERDTIDSIANIVETLKHDKLTIAFAAEFSRGKTELINALFFAETGVRLLPSMPGRTTMCPTEIFYDASGDSYIKLLSIETRMTDKSIAEYREDDQQWLHVPLRTDSPEQMQKAFQELIAVKQVTRDEADALGLLNEENESESTQHSHLVEIPKWRHALISFPHPLLKDGLSILDTPGLNALGAEPELTLNMLPSAQAIVFVLAADTGVTKSDMDMWKQHIFNAKKRGEKNKQGFAVVLNKIDSMWDDLSGEMGYERSIHNQTQSTSSILGVPVDQIFPMSAKQALMGKIRQEKDLINRSRIAKLEDFFAKELIGQKQKLLTESVVNEIGFLINESSGLIENRITNSQKELEEFKSIDFKNTEKTSKLMAETRDRQNAYMTNVENFQQSRRVFAVQAKMLLDALSKDKVDHIVKVSRKEISRSATTIGMKSSIAKLFDELHVLLDDAVDITDEIQLLVTAIHKKFQEEYGFKEISPKLFSFQSYKDELEAILAEGDEFRRSTRTTMTEQSVVVNRLYSTLIYRAKDVLKRAHKDATTWSNNVLTPLLNQIKDHKKQIEVRLEALHQINSSKGDVLDNIKKLEQQIDPLKQQRKELLTIIKLMNITAN